MGTGDVSKGCSSHLFSCISRFVWQPRKDTIQTTWTPEREVCKQFIYNISDFYSGFGAVFPGIEASSSILQCTFPSFSAKSVQPSVNLPSSSIDFDVTQQQLCRHSSAVCADNPVYTISPCDTPHGLKPSSF